ncbi:exonuclease, partial [Escherichia coli]
MLVPVDFELGPLVAEFGRTQHVTGPEVVLAGPAEQYTHVAVVTSITFTHQTDIVTGIDVRAVEQGDDAWHKLRLGVITA